MNILSLFDGMSCGMLAMLKAGVQVDNYYAYEIDKYAIQTATHNFPQIQECGDVFNADFTKHHDIDFLIGGSPCTYWSIAQSPDKRETTASGKGWELFSQYVRALKESKPRYFIYENNKSMSKAIRDSITQTFGFDPICINSALVSAQNRQRLYWIGKRNTDGAYSKVDVQQPKDKGILLKDALDCVTGRKTGVQTQSKQYRELTEKEMDYMVRDHLDRRWSFCQRPAQDAKAKCLVANLAKGVPYNVCAIPAKAVSEPYEKAYTVYEVKNGDITIKGKAYPIKLIDGCYIIRKLTVSECQRLQTVPDWYEFPVSNAQSYKLIGNGWTVDVIVHLIEATRE